MRGRTEVLRRIMRNTFWDAYDHLGTLVLSNLLSFLFCIAAGAVPFAMAEVTRLWWLLLCLPLAAGSCCTAGMLRVTYDMAVRREARAWDFFRGMAELWRPTSTLALLSLAALCVAMANVAFYANVSAAHPLVGLALAAFCLWVTLAFFACMQFVLPAAVELWMARIPGTQNSISPTVRMSLRMGLTLLLQAPVVAAVLLMNLALLWAVCLATGVGVVLLGPGVTGLALHHAYGEANAELEGVGDRRADEQRSLGELIRPWEAHGGRGSGSGSS